MYLTDTALAAALRDAADVAFGDSQHDLMTALDVLARDYRPDLRGVGVQRQLAHAVVMFADPRARTERPVDVAAAWCREHGARLDVLLRAVADAVEARAEAAA